MHIAYLLLGGNTGNRGAMLEAARQGIQREVGEILRQSAIYETAAWGKENQADFLNQAIEVETALPARDLLAACLGIEAGLGRVRKETNGPRPIDIDILFFDHDVYHTPLLQVPHPRMPQRRFVLVPLAELIPDYRHPQLHQSVGQLLEACTDPLPVKKYNPS